MKKKRLLITGVSGLLGSNLAYYFRERYAVSGTYFSHALELPGVQCRSADITRKEDMKALMNELAPDVIIHCAALADPDTCEENPALAERLNVDAVRNVVGCIGPGVVKLIYISTDAVYDGKTGHYREIDSAHALNVYGRTKRRGEEEAGRHPGALVVRTNIFGWNCRTHRSLGQWIINELAAGRRIKGFTDVHFSSIYTMVLAELLDVAIQKDLSGVYHMVSRTSLSKYEFAVQLARIFGLDSSLISPGSVDDFNFRATRAKNLQLNTEKMCQDAGVDIPKLQDSIEAFYADYLAGLPRAIGGGAALAGAEKLS